MDSRKGGGGSTLVPAVLTLLLYIAVIGASAYAIIRVEEAMRYNAIQDQRLLQFVDQHERDINTLRATDESNLALVEGEILMLVNRINQCCARNDTYDDSSLLFLLEQERLERQGNDTILLGLIQQERTERQGNDTGLLVLIDQERIERQGNDTGLLTLINQERTERQGNDTGLLVLINQERIERQGNDTGLSTAINQERIERQGNDTGLLFLIDRERIERQGNDTGLLYMIQTLEMQQGNTTTFMSFIEQERAWREGNDTNILLLLQQERTERQGNDTTHIFLLLQERIEREGNDTILLSLIQQERTERQGNDTGLLLLINQERIERQGNDTGLTVLIDQERIERQGNDTGLLLLINQERIERQGNDTDTQLLIQQERTERLSNDTYLLYLIQTVEMQQGNTTTFMSFIEQERAWREGNDTSILTLLQQEIVDRQTNDTSLLLLIQQERAQREFNDSAVSGLVQQEALDRAAKDMILMGNVSSLRDVAVLTINGLPATANNIQIVAQQGIQITNMTSTISIRNTGVLSVNMRAPDPVTGESLLTGAGMISINPGALPHENVVDGSVLATAINNLDMTVSMHSMDIMNLQNKDIDLQNQINALNVSGTIMSLITNDSTFNVTILSILNNLTMLQSQVAVLQAQVANLSAIAVVTGTIVPWAGNSMAIPSSYLYCDGASYSQTTYAALYAVVGCQYCPSMMCTMSNFCVPDLRGRVPVGQHNVSGAFMTRGASVGSETHTLTIDQIPSHSHTLTTNGGHDHSGVTGQSGDHQHDLVLRRGCGCADSGNCISYQANIFNQIQNGAGDRAFTGSVVSGIGGDPSFGQCSPGAQAGYPYLRFNHQFDANSGATPGGNHIHGFTTGAAGAHTHTVGSAGSSGSHPIIQPSVVVGGYMIKT